MMNRHVNDDGFIRRHALPPDAGAVRLLTTILLATLLAAAAGSAAADSRRTVQQRFTDYAQVIDVQPRYQEVSIRDPQQECWIEETRHVVREEGYRYDDYDRRAPVGHRIREGRSGADTVVGGLIGGVIGNQLGRHSSDGKRAGATVAGVIIGSAVANEVGDNRHNHRELPHRRPHYEYSPPRYTTTQVERCRETASTRYEQRMAGYDVTYRYRGQTFTTNMSRDPGSRLELQVSVSPARE